MIATLNKYINKTSEVKELPDADMELNSVLKILHDPNFSFETFTGAPKTHEELTPEQREELEKEQKLFEEKYKKSEATLADVRDKFNDIDKHTLKMLQHTPYNIIIEMAVRLFVGSRDIPKNVDKALKLIQIAKEKSKTDLTDEEAYDIEFFEIILEKLNNQNKNDPSLFWEINGKLK